MRVEVKVLDFGLAKALDPETRIGHRVGAILPCRRR